jgi:hypothetical protein
VTDANAYQFVLKGPFSVLFLSVGMPRAGSGWHYNLIHDLVVASGGQDARVVRRKYHLERFLTEVNCNIGALTTRRLLPVLAPALLGNSYVIKAHAGPSATARTLIRRELLRATYIYRDPRDALLSAFEHGERSRTSGYQNAFARLKTFEDALKFMEQYLKIWQAWVATPGVLITRYEDLLADYDAQVARLLAFLKITADQPPVQAVLEQYRPEHTRDTGQRGLHFRQGKVGRYRQVFTPDEVKAADQAFAPYLERMGYPIYAG